MYAPAFGRSPPQDGGPLLVARRYGTPEAEPGDGDLPEENNGRGGRRHTGEDEDDSLAVVFSADTGAGRAHTPQRMNRTHTPQRLRPSSLLHMAVAPVQQSSATRGGGDARRQPLGRRKQRRWDNDNLLGVEKFLRGRHALEEGEAEHLTVSHSWRSSLADLVSDKNTSAAAAEVRESIRKGVQPSGEAAQAGGGGGGASNSGSRRFAGGKWEDAEDRFLLVERRLRDIVVRALRSSALLSFVVGLEALLEGFAKDNKAPSEMPEALRSALASRPRVEAEAGKPVGVRGALLVPLGPSPFHRLLLHALCQYRRLHSRSEETDHGRVVRVAAPTSRAASAVPDVPLTAFVLETRLRASVAGGGGDAEAGRVRASQAPPQAATAPAIAAGAVRCGEESPAEPSTTTAVTGVA